MDWRLFGYFSNKDLLIKRRSLEMRLDDLICCFVDWIDMIGKEFYFLLILGYFWNKLYIKMENNDFNYCGEKCCR